MGWGAEEKRRGEEEEEEGMLGKAGMRGRDGGGEDGGRGVGGLDHLCDGGAHHQTFAHAFGGMQ